MKKLNLRHIKKKVQKLYENMRNPNIEQSIEHVNSTEAQGMLDWSLRCLRESKNDPRPRLEVYRLLPTHTVYCLATPVKKHDPLMIYPQAFYFYQNQALSIHSSEQLEHLNSKDFAQLLRSEITDTCSNQLGIPIFTSLFFLREFASSQNFEVKGPDGTSWLSDTILNERKCKKSSRYFPPSELNEPCPIYECAYPVYPLQYPCGNHFVGCFGDFNRVIEHLKIFPKMTSIIINPSSSSQLTLPLQTGEKIASNMAIESALYHEIGKRVSTEIHMFFSHHCPEVNSCGYIVAPRGTKADSQYNDHPYVISFVVSSLEFQLTIEKLKRGRKASAWYGHPSVSFVDISLIDPLWKKGIQTFYLKENQGELPTISRDGCFKSFSCLKTWDPI